MYFTPEFFFYVFMTFIRDAPGISEKDDNSNKSTKVTKVSTNTEGDMVILMIVYCSGKHIEF